MKDYFDEDFNFEDENFNMKEFMDFFNKTYKKLREEEDRLDEESKEEWEWNFEGDPLDDIDKVQNFGLEPEQLLDADSTFSKIMKRLEEQRFEKELNENYLNLKSKGLDVLELKTFSKEDQKKVVETIHIMQETFLNREEYEKCAVLRPIIQKIEKEIKL